MMRERLKCNAVPIQLPIGSEDTFKGLIDLVEMKAYVYYDDLGKDIRCEEIPEDMKELAEKYHTEMIEHVAEQDDALMEKYLMGEELTIDEIKTCIRKSTINNTMVPVTCGTSYKNKGVQKLLDAIVDYMPAPTDVPSIKGVNPETEEEDVRHSSDTEPFSALAFKIATDRSSVSCASSVCTPVRLRLVLPFTTPQRITPSVSAVLFRCTQTTDRIWKWFTQATSLLQLV